MAVWSTVFLSRLRGDLRLDAEYYEPHLLAIEKLIHQYVSGWKPLSEIADIITDGDHLKRDYKTSGVLFLTSEHITEHHISYDSSLYIDPVYECTLERARSEPGAVFLTKTGRWYGKAAVCLSDATIFNISADIAKIRLKKGYSPFFLACFLNSRIGYALVRRESTGGSRDRIVLENLRTLPVPLVTDEEGRFERIVNRISAAQKKAADCLVEAEAILISDLGLDRVDLLSPLFYEDFYFHTSEVDRLDAEYFSPRMQKIIETLSVDGMTIGDVAPLAKQRVKSDLDATFSYIEIADICNLGIAGSKPVAREDAPSRATWLVQPGDIITTTVRPIRRLTAIILPEQDRFVCSSGFAVLRPRDIEPELMLTYLRLPLVAELLDIHATASMYPTISTADLLRIPFRMPDAKARAHIVAKIRESFAARADYFRLLSEAKRTVEVVIEAETIFPEKL